MLCRPVPSSRKASASVMHRATNDTMENVDSLNEKPEQEKDYSLWHRIEDFGHDTWFWELGSMTLSCSGLIAMIVFLWILDGKAVPSWTHTITPNAIVSILSTAIKATMIFGVSNAIGQLKWFHLKSRSHRLGDLQYYDSASRGPLGALDFVWHLRHFRYLPRTMLLGCLIIVVAIAMDPFSQQVLKYYSKSTNSWDRPQGSITMCDSEYNLGTDGVDPRTREVVGERDLGLVRSFFRALLNVTEPLQYSCPTEKCLFDFAVSYGPHSECTDITNSSSISPLNGTTRDIVGYNVAFPEAVNLQIKAEPGSGTYSFSQVEAAVRLPTESGHFSQSGGIAQVYVLQLLGDRPRSSIASGSQNGTLHAWRCDISLVRHNYLFGVMDFPDGLHFNRMTMQPPRSGEGNLKRYIKVPTYVQMRDKNDWWEVVIPHHDSFTINKFDFLAIQQLFAQFNISQPGQASSSSPSSSSSSSAPSSSALTLSNYMVEDALRSFTDIPTLFHQIATSVREHMRMNSPQLSTYTGHAVYIRQHVEVRWRWLVLPIALVALSVGFLFTVVMLNRRNEQPAWKSSLYPLLTLKLPPTSNDDVSDQDQRVGVPDTIRWRLSEMAAICKTAKTDLFVPELRLTNDEEREKS